MSLFILIILIIIIGILFASIPFVLVKKFSKISIIVITASAIIVAFYIGILGVFREEIINISNNPSIDYKIKKSSPSEVYTVCEFLNASESYNLTIKNKGNTPLRNIKIKIREKEEASWLNLVRPFSNIFITDENKEPEKVGENIDKFYLNNLSPGEEDDFTFGYFGSSIEKEETFFILATQTCLDTNNQSIRITTDESKEYFLEIVADNMKPKSFEIMFNIYQDGFLNITPKIDQWYSLP